MFVVHYTLFYILLQEGETNSINLSINPSIKLILVEQNVNDYNMES